MHEGEDAAANLGVQRVRADAEEFHDAHLTHILIIEVVLQNPDLVKSNGVTQLLTSAHEFWSRDKPGAVDVHRQGQLAHVQLLCLDAVTDDLDHGQHGLRVSLALLGSQSPFGELGLKMTAATHPGSDESDVADELYLYIYIITYTQGECQVKSFRLRYLGGYDESVRVCNL